MLDNNVTDLDLSNQANEEEARIAYNLVHKQDDGPNLASGEFVENIVKAARRIDDLSDALEKVINKRLYRKDWTLFGDGSGATYSLGAAGAERLLLVFPFQFDEKVETIKEEFTDANGSGYRYVCKVKCDLYGTKIQATGTHSTRDNLLGKRQGEFRDVSEINENDIEKAAERSAIGNAIKTLLGLRHMPVEEIDRIYAKTGRTLPDSRVTYNATMSDDDKTNRETLIEIMKEITGNDTEKMKALLRECSKFEGKDGKEKFMSSFDGSSCKGKWLSNTLRRAQAMKQEQDDQIDALSAQMINE